MKTKLIIHPEELTKEWVDLAKENGVNALGIHSVGNSQAHVNLLNDLSLFESDSYKNIYYTSICVL